MALSLPGSASRGLQCLLGPQSGAFVFRSEHSSWYGTPLLDALFSSPDPLPPGTGNACSVAPIIIPPGDPRLGPSLLSGEESLAA